MQQVFRAYGHYRGLKGNVSTLPSWGKPVLLLAALPGIVLLIVSVLLLIVLFLVSILALLLLTAPVYRVLRMFAPKPAQADFPPPPRGEEVFVQSPAPRRPVEVKILEE
jgi:hypothetical protein